MFHIEKKDVVELKEGGVIIERWRESYGDIDILVEIKKGDWGGLKNRLTERAVVQKAGGKKRLFKAEKTFVNGKLVLDGCSIRGFSGDSAREMAFVWAMGHSLSAQAEFLEADRARRKAIEDSVALEVLLAAEMGVMHYLAHHGVGGMSTIDLADIVGLSSHRLGAWLGSQGFAQRHQGNWVALNSALQSGARGKHIVWNAVGLNEIRVRLFQKKIFFMTEEALLRTLQKRAPGSPVWAVIEKARRGVLV